MKIVFLFQLVVIELILSSTTDATCCGRDGQRVHSKKNANLETRAKRGKVFLAPYEDNNVESESNEEKIKKTSLAIKENNEFPDNEKNDTKVEFRTKTDLPQKYIIKRLIKNVDKNQGKNNSKTENPERILVDPKDNSPETRQNKYKCYCKQVDCPHKNNELYFSNIEELMNDDYDRDTSAEEIDNPNISNVRNVRIQKSSRSSILTTEPTKYKIPFLSNDNDSQIPIDRINPNTKLQQNYYQPVSYYQNQMLNGISNQHFPVHQYYPYSDPGVTYPQLSNQQNYAAFASKVPESNDYITDIFNKNFPEINKCTILFGRKICVISSTTRPSLNEVETIDLSEDTTKPYSNEDENNGDTHFLESDYYKNFLSQKQPTYATQYNYQANKQEASNTFVEESSNIASPYLHNVFSNKAHPTDSNTYTHSYTPNFYHSIQTNNPTSYENYIKNSNLPHSYSSSYDNILQNSAQYTTTSNSYIPNYYNQRASENMQSQTSAVTMPTNNYFENHKFTYDPPDSHIPIEISYIPTYDHNKMQRNIIQSTPATIFTYDNSRHINSFTEGPTIYYTDTSNSNVPNYEHHRLQQKSVPVEMATQPTYNIVEKSKLFTEPSVAAHPSNNYNYVPNYNYYNPQQNTVPTDYRSTDGNSGYTNSYTGQPTKFDAVTNSNYMPNYDYQSLHKKTVSVETLMKSMLTAKQTAPNTAFTDNNFSPNYNYQWTQPNQIQTTPRISVDDKVNYRPNQPDEFNSAVNAPYNNYPDLYQKTPTVPYTTINNNYVPNYNYNQLHKNTFNSITNPINGNTDHLKSFTKPYYKYNTTPSNIDVRDYDYYNVNQNSATTSSYRNKEDRNLNVIHFTEPNLKSNNTYFLSPNNQKLKQNVSTPFTNIINYYTRNPKLLNNKPVSSFTTSVNDNMPDYNYQRTQKNVEKTTANPIANTNFESQNLTTYLLMKSNDYNYKNIQQNENIVANAPPIYNNFDNFKTPFNKHYGSYTTARNIYIPNFGSDNTEQKLTTMPISNNYQYSATSNDPYLSYNNDQNTHKNKASISTMSLNGNTDNPGFFTTKRYGSYTTNSNSNIPNYSFYNTKQISNTTPYNNIRNGDITNYEPTQSYAAGYTSTLPITNPVDTKVAYATLPTDRPITSYTAAPYVPYINYKMSHNSLQPVITTSPMTPSYTYENIPNSKLFSGDVNNSRETIPGNNNMQEAETQSTIPSPPLDNSHKFSEAIINEVSSIVDYNESNEVSHEIKLTRHPASANSYLTNYNTQQGQQKFSQSTTDKISEYTKTEKPKLFYRTAGTGDDNYLYNNKPSDFVIGNEQVHFNNQPTESYAATYISNYRRLQQKTKKVTTFTKSVYKSPAYSTLFTEQPSTSYAPTSNNYVPNYNYQNEPLNINQQTSDNNKDENLNTLVHPSSESHESRSNPYIPNYNSNNFQLNVIQTTPAAISAYHKGENVDASISPSYKDNNSSYVPNYNYNSILQNVIQKTTPMTTNYNNVENPDTITAPISTSYETNSRSHVPNYDNNYLTQNTILSMPATIPTYSKVQNPNTLVGSTGAPYKISSNSYAPNRDSNRIPQNIVQTTPNISSYNKVVNSNIFTNSQSESYASSNNLYISNYSYNHKSQNVTQTTTPKTLSSPHSFVNTPRLSYELRDNPYAPNYNYNYPPQNTTLIESTTVLTYSKIENPNDPYVANYNDHNLQQKTVPLESTTNSILDKDFPDEQSNASHNKKIQNQVNQPITSQPPYKISFSNQNNYVNNPVINFNMPNIYTSKESENSYQNYAPFTNSPYISEPYTNPSYNRVPYTNPSYNNTTLNSKTLTPREQISLQTTHNPLKKESKKSREQISLQTTHNPLKKESKKSQPNLLTQLSALYSTKNLINSRNKTSINSSLRPRDTKLQDIIPPKDGNIAEDFVKPVTTLEDVENEEYKLINFDLETMSTLRSIDKQIQTQLSSVNSILLNKKDITSNENIDKVVQSLSAEDSSVANQDNSKIYDTAESFKGIEKIILNNENLDLPAEISKINCTDFASLRSDENISQQNKIVTNNPIQDENEVQAVDESPSVVFENASEFDPINCNEKCLSNIDNPDNVNDAIIEYKNEALLQNAIKKVINNLVPGNAQDLMANYGNEKGAELVGANIEDLNPEIIGNPILKNLLSLPEVENMITDTASNFITQITGLPIISDIIHLIRNALHNVIDKIPRPRPTVPTHEIPRPYPIVPTYEIPRPYPTVPTYEIPDPYPTVPIPITVEEHKIENGEWVTENIKLLEKSPIVGASKNPPKEVFDMIKSIIDRSDLEEQVVAQPIIQNLIIKTVKHCLDKEKGIIDESTIRQALNLIVQPKALNSSPKITPKIKEKELKKEKIKEKELIAKPPRPTSVSNEDYKIIPLIPVTEHVLRGDSWSETRNTLVNKLSKQDFDENKRQLLLQKLEEQRINKLSRKQSQTDFPFEPNNYNTDTANIEDEGFNEEKKKIIEQKLRDLKLKSSNSIENITNSSEKSKIVITKSLDYVESNEKLENISYEGDRSTETVIDESIERKPIKYYSPQDRILEYIKNHNTERPLTTMAEIIGRSNDEHNIESSPRTLFDGEKIPLNKKNYHDDPAKVTEYPTAAASTLVHFNQQFPNNIPINSLEETTNDNLKSENVETSTNEVSSEAKIVREANDQLNLLKQVLGTPNSLYQNSNEQQSQDSPYLGRLIPLDQKASQAKDITDLQDSNLVYIGDGVKLPLTIRKMQDGTFALTLSDEVCKQFMHKKCPCCLPNDNNGIILREKRNRGTESYLHFSDEKSALPSQESKDTIEDLNADSKTSRVRRASGEYNKETPLNTFKNEKLHMNRKFVPKFSSVNKTPRNSNEDLITNTLNIVETNSPWIKVITDNNKKNNIKNRPAKDWVHRRIQKRIENDSRKIEKAKKKRIVMFDNNSKHKSKPIRVNFNYQDNNPLLVVTVKEPEYQPITERHRFYRYQTYADDNMPANSRTEALKNMLNLMKNIVISRRKN